MNIRTQFSRAWHGFTLLELLIVTSIIAVLAGMIFSVGPGVLRSMRKKSVLGDMQQLELAIREYRNEYGRYPASIELQGSDVVVGGPGSSAGTDDLMNILLAEPEGWNDAHVLNPKRIQFISPRPATGSYNNARNGLGEDGKLYDMWGNEFRILMDTSYDEKLNGAAAQGFDYSDKDIKTSDGSFSGKIMILSVGEDGVFGSRKKVKSAGKGDTASGSRIFKGSDDVVSWF